MGKKREVREMQEKAMRENGLIVGNRSGLGASGEPGRTPQDDGLMGLRFGAAPPAQAAPGTRETQPDSECICKGNWRSIVAKTEPLLGKYFTDLQGQQWYLFGIVHADDDFYYGMSNEGKLKLLSCVGSIEGHGYTLAQPGAPTKEGLAAQALKPTPAADQQKCERMGEITR